MNVLANDGLDKSGIEALTAKGFNVITKNVPQDFLIGYINEHKIKTLLVRSATEVSSVRRRLLRNLWRNWFLHTFLQAPDFCRIRTAECL